MNQLLIVFYVINSGLVLFEKHKFFPRLIIIDADTVNGPCFVIESYSKNKVVYLVKERELQARAFTKVYADDSEL